jgi:hypothetical protein
MAASPGFAPGPPVSETGALLITPRGSAQARIANNQWQIANASLRLVICHLLLAIAPKALVEPEVVATSPNRIKSPAPVYCGFDSAKMARQAEARRAKVGARGRIRTCTGDALNVVSLLLDYASCWRRAIKWILQPVLPRPDFFTKEIRRLLRGGAKWPAEPKLAGIAGVCPPAHSVLRRGSLALAMLRAKAGAGERNRTVVSALARPHSAVEPHLRKWRPQPDSHRQPGA